MRVVSAVILALLVSAPFAAGAKKPPDSGSVPQAALSSRPTMTVPNAMRTIREGLQKGIRGDHGLFGRGCDVTYENITVTFTQLAFTRVEKCENRRYESPPESFSFRFPELPDWIHELGERLGFADALDAIAYYSSTAAVTDDGPALAGFREKAGEWRALPVKPTLTEDVRRFKLLAEDSIRRKEFDAAVDYYEQGLAVSPLWPEGQFNAALLYGEMEIYSQAVLHMTRYLELSPDASDAQAARDQVVIWNAKLPQARPSAQRAGGAKPQAPWGKGSR